MESLITQLSRQDVWDEYIAYRLLKGRFTWHEFREADRFVEKEQYLHLVQEIAQGEGLGLPKKKIVNKMGTGKKRVVYSFSPEEMMVLKVIAFKLYDYDGYFAPNCYAFRRGLKVHDAVFHLNQAVADQKMWAYKLDIHDYFNSIPIGILLPMLKEMMANDPLLYRFFQEMLSNDSVIYNGETIHERHGVMAGTPTSPFLANVYLKEVDRFFHDAGVIYARYSDDIIPVATELATLEEYKRKMAEFLEQYQLEVNPDKDGHDIDISEAAKKKMKGKIKRAAKSLMRWRNTKHIEAEKAMKGLINHFNKKFFENDDNDGLTWSRWFFPVINQTDGLKEIDHYLQQNIRYLSTGKHSKANYRTDYAKLKQLGYRSLVKEYFEGK